MQNIYNKKVNVKTGIEPNLFNETFKVLNIAVDKSFARVEFNKPNTEFVNQLKYNNAVFAAFKAHREQNDLASNLLDKDGKLKSFQAFKKDTQHIVYKYEKWRNTEYNTAVIRARQAANFKKFEEDADLFPNLKWLPSTSIDKRDLHTPFYNKVWPIKDKFWLTHTPGDLWNCKCGLTNTNEEPDGDKVTAHYKPSDGLEGNPAFTSEIFNIEKHPYRLKGHEKPAVLDKIVNSNVKSLFLKEIDTKLDGFRKTIHPYKGLEVTNNKLATGKLTLLRKTIKEIDFHNADILVKQYIPNLIEDIKNWEYLGWADVEPGKHPEAAYFFYYKTVIGEKTRFINVIMHKNLKTEMVYTILDDIDMRSLKTSLPKDIELYTKK